MGVRFSLCVTSLLTFFAIVSTELFVFCLSDYTCATWGSPGAQKEHEGLPPQTPSTPSPAHLVLWGYAFGPLAWNLGLVAPLCYLLPVTALLSGVTWLEDREREKQQEFAHPCAAQNSPSWRGRLPHCCLCGSCFSVNAHFWFRGCSETRRRGRGDTRGK